MVDKSNKQLKPSLLSSQISYAKGVSIVGAIFIVIVAEPVCACEQAGVESLETLIKVILCLLELIYQKELLLGI